jgi:hypothetical protein
MASPQSRLYGRAAEFQKTKLFATGRLLPTNGFAKPYTPRVANAAFAQAESVPHPGW